MGLERADRHADRQVVIHQSYTPRDKETHIQPGRGTDGQIIPSDDIELVRCRNNTRTDVHHKLQKQTWQTHLPVADGDHRPPLSLHPSTKNATVDQKEKGWPSDIAALSSFFVVIRKQNNDRTFMENHFCSVGYGFYLLV